jgi:ribose/xylose/arabinose/galactoside ABC-type transport system permease subunit
MKRFGGRRRAGASKRGLNMTGGLFRGICRRIGRSREATILAIILALCAGLSAGSRFFLNPANFESLQATLTPNAIIATGMMILLISGVFDLSVGSVMGLSGAVTAIVLSRGVPVAAAVCIGFGVGLSFGVANGLLVAQVGVNPLIATMGTLYIGRGLITSMLSGTFRTIKIDDAAFLTLGQGKTFGVYNMFWIMAAIVAVSQFVVTRTYFGRRLYYVGGNAEAARVVGIKVKRIRVAAFALSGFLSALAGILYTSRLGNSAFYLGLNVELQVIISCLIGGAAVSGGRGTVVGGLLGVVFMAVVVSVFNILEVSMFWQNIVIGTILIGIVSADAYSVRRRKRISGILE